MSYDIIEYGDQATDGLRRGGHNPNFPPGETQHGHEALKWGDDIRNDPADPDVTSDPKQGWERGIGLGTQVENADA